MYVKENNRDRDIICRATVNIEPSITNMYPLTPKNTPCIIVSAKLKKKKNAQAKFMF